MPILVVCPGCKARFQVSEKFAGKEGPCPKCKQRITVPKVEEQVQIHAPEQFAEGGKTAAGAPVLKPIARKETRFEAVPVAMGACTAVVILAVAWIAGKFLQEAPAVRAVGLLLISAPIAAAGYTFLRDDELEPHRGKFLWLRAAICAAAYTGLWIGFYFIPNDLLSESWQWLFVAPPFVLAGGGIALVCFDLDYGSGCFHYAFYLLITMAVGWLAGLQMPWQMIST